MNNGKSYWMDISADYRLTGRWSRDYSVMFLSFCIGTAVAGDGAFGLRGLYERKPHFIDSIQPGLHSIDRLFQSGRLDADYAEIRRVCRQLLE